MLPLRQDAVSMTSGIYHTPKSASPSNTGVFGLDAPALKALLIGSTIAGAAAGHTSTVGTHIREAVTISMGRTGPIVEGTMVGDVLFALGGFGDMLTKLPMVIDHCLHALPK